MNNYIYKPYVEGYTKPMLLSRLYPFICDSLGFPSVMMEIANRLEPEAEVVWDPDYHYLIDVTYNGETRQFGGAGSGGGQKINEDQIEHIFTFDGFGTDSYTELDLKTLRDMIEHYGELEVPKFTDPNALTWKEIRNTVGPDGGYIRINLANSYSGTTWDIVRGYSYIYDNGRNSEDSIGFADIGCMTNTWFDGRYFNKWEEYYAGAEFTGTVESVQPSLTFRDYQYTVGDIGVYAENCKITEYRFTKDDDGNNIGSWDSYSLADLGYDAESGIWTWDGYTTFTYDAESGTWISPLLDRVYYYDRSTQKYIHLRDDPEYGESFRAACTITMEEALAMNLDRNTNVDPTEYYIYDMTEEPGTYHGSN